ncbi:hypothetical protein COO60DRAFT_71316 [Scenedesmus sp. NREL 46B-D3]|nr:hypothetical protein COO60DRAFT_71316 [Scenedesmus sp. NREL 46B-D3]
MSAAGPPAATSGHFTPAAVPFIVPAAFKSVRTIGAEGKEEHADDNPWVHMQLKDPFTQQQSAQTTVDLATLAAAGPDGLPDAAAAAAEAAAAEAEAAADEAPRPEEVMKAFASAKGELEWLQATLATLREGRYLTVGKVEKPGGPQLLVDIAAAANSRYQRRSAAAAAAAAALSEGAAALSALGSKEDAFYEQVAQLQRFWKVQSEPPGSAYAYSVNLRLTSSSSSSDSAEPEPSAAAAAIGRGSVPVVHILKDPSGMLRVQVPAQKDSGAPSVTRKGLEGGA